MGDLKCAIVLHLAQLLQNFESVKLEPAHPTENRWMILLALFLPGLVYFDCPGLFWILTLGHCSVYMLLGSCFYTYRHRQTHTHTKRDSCDMQNIRKMRCDHPMAPIFLCIAQFCFYMRRHDTRALALCPGWALVGSRALPALCCLFGSPARHWQ